MIDLNGVWSDHPKHQPVDRTGLVRGPVRWDCQRPWSIPTHQLTLDDALASRAKQIEQLQQRINIFWSGGIDSTTVITAFLQNLTSVNQLRILYTPYSTYDYPEFVPYLQKNFDMELVDISGMVYMDTQFDGVFVTGDGGDELMASLDQSFIDSYGIKVLDQPWPDFFLHNGHSQALIDFCHEHFAQAGRPIETVLEARWWFYTCFKNRSVLVSKLNYFNDYLNFDHTRCMGFFDCKEFESYIYYNIDQILSGTSYHNWKQIFKDYCYAHNKLEDWYCTIHKTHNAQLAWYTAKKIVLKNCRSLGQISDNNCIKLLSLPSLPFVSRQEYNEQLYAIMDPLVNDTV
jgi:hypothetical protein